MDDDAALGHVRFWLPLPAQRGHFWTALGREADELLSSDEESAAVAVDQQQRFASGFAHGALELRDVADGLMVDFLDDVALLQAGVGHFAGGVDVGDDDALGR